MYGNLVQDFFTKAANWPFGAALSMVMFGGDPGSSSWSRCG